MNLISSSVRMFCFDHLLSGMLTTSFSNLVALPSCPAIESALQIAGILYPLLSIHLQDLPIQGMY